VEKTLISRRRWHGNIKLQLKNLELALQNT